MQVIPVLDLKDGEAVHAIAGRRADYRPVRSALCAGSQPAALAQAMLKATGARQLYVADLAAIMHDDTQRHAQILRELCQVVARHQGELWLDAGWRDAGRSIWRADLQTAAVRAGARIEWIVGSESLGEGAGIPTDSILSLDYADGRFLGPPGLDSAPQLWPERVILMELNRVGSGSGPALNSLERLRATASAPGARATTQWFLGGGVRGPADLEAATRSGAQGVLIASALHDGRLFASG